MHGADECRESVNTLSTFVLKHQRMHGLSGVVVPGRKRCMCVRAVCTLSWTRAPACKQPHGCDLACDTADTAHIFTEWAELGVRRTTSGHASAFA